MTDQLHLGVALDGYGWHPRAWRATLTADPATESVLSGRYWAGLAATAERGLLDFLTIDDTLMPQSGRREEISPRRLADEAADAVEVVRRLWDSWEDDAVIRDVATGRYIDRNKLHYIDFHGEHFSVKGPSITPRPPQGQPVVAALAHATRIYEFAAASSDLVFITPADDAAVRAIVGEVRAAGDADLKIFADIVVTFGGDAEFGSDALIFTGSAKEFVELLLEWQRLGIDGARLRPAVNGTDLPVIVDEVVPLLQRAGRFRTDYAQSETLRQRLSLPVAPNRYTKVTP
jgi:alkanesulfonate monooxygenase SsuD/methylene tetrahydromethanopterin reductase-like flavin-dependent oxidoreductase (luciferase family)